MRRVEWPTLALLAACYALWGLATFFYEQIGPVFCWCCWPRRW